MYTLNKLKNMKRFHLLLLVTVLLSSCYRYPSIDARQEDRDLTLTFYDSLANFNEYTTVAVSDTVSLLKIVNGSPVDSVVGEPYSSTIINSVTNNMIALGYTIVGENENPDLVMALSVVDSEIDGWYQSGDCYYPPYWGWGYYGWGYCYAYPVYYYDRLGSAVIDMIDLKNYSGVGDYKGLWHASIQSYLDKSLDNTIDARLKSGIQEAFDQSPYLNLE
jgi:hypothetical protein